MSSKGFDVSNFSERFGYMPVQGDLSEFDMPSSLRAGLWDIFMDGFLRDIYGPSNVYATYSKGFESLCNHIWFGFLHEPTDTIPSKPGEALKSIRSQFFSWPFFKVYSFLEFSTGLLNSNIVACKITDFEEKINLVLSRERAAFRFTNGILVKISDEHQLAEVSKSISQDKSESVRLHIKRAAELYSELPAPDYRNSVKESISAVEGAVAFVTGSRSGGISKPLKRIAEKYEIHQSLRDGFEKIYAWTSDASGIRHRIMDKAEVSQDDARYMLIACSAFSNYLIALHLKFGYIILSE